ncbi:hypothetical protein FDB61_17930 [Clostridium botulinum]|nr:hypothetical protein [Clostridium botulinum]
MATKLKRYSICIDDKTYEILNNISKSEDKTLAEVTREIIKRGLAAEWVDENKDMVSSIVREELRAVLKPSVERLAKISSKAGHMSATAAFLNVQALMDLIPKERQRDVRPMYSKARKMAVDYMKNKTEDWDVKNFGKNLED